MDYYFQQTSQKPLFPNLLWSRPENKQAAGRLLIIGGHKFSFAAPVNAYTQVVNAGVGAVRILLPNSVKSALPNAKDFLDICTFTPSTKSGGFAKSALSDFLAESLWAQGVYFPGDLGKNSETTSLIESYLKKSALPNILTGDALETTATFLPKLITDKKVDTRLCLVLSFSQLQRLVTELHFSHPVLFSMPHLKLVHTLHLLTEMYSNLHIVTYKAPHFLVASGGNVATHESSDDGGSVWRTKIASRASVFWIQNQSTPFEALSSCLL